MLSDLVAVPGGVSRIGQDDAYPEEAPARTLSIAPFRLERHPVTIAQFAAFVEETGYRTVAERSRIPRGGEIFANPRADLPGSLVFIPSAVPVHLTPTPEEPQPWRRWWRFVPGASWHHPLGPMADLDGRLVMRDHPVVHVCAADAEAYATWAGRRLPTAGEFEHASRAGSTTKYSWGEEAEPGRFHQATTWVGPFPHHDARFTDADAHHRHGWVGTSAVGSVPANRWGLEDMIGNVWEWTADTRAAGGGHDVEASCCAGGGTTAHSLERVLKGGSHLCAPEYCQRYRPAAIQFQHPEASSSHIGFRCAV